MRVTLVLNGLKTFVQINLIRLPENGLLKSSRSEVFCKKGVLRNFTKFLGKHLCQSLFFNKVTGSGLNTFFYVFFWWLLLLLRVKESLFIRFLDQNIRGTCGYKYCGYNVYRYLYYETTNVNMPNALELSQLNKNNFKVIDLLSEFFIFQQVQRCWLLFSFLVLNVIL